MSMKYVARIQTNLKRYQTIRTDKEASRLLDGSYHSVFKGRSMNFDELREYVIGDDVKDIDWKAYARSQKLLVKQYIAEKKHDIMLVFDTNRKMLADANETQEKREIAIMAAGTLAYLVNQNGDFISAIYGSNQKVHYLPFRTGLMNIENILSHFHDSITWENESNINDTLDYIVHHFKKKMILILVTDMKGIQAISDTTFKRLLVMNDVLVMDINDADIEGKNVYDMGSERYMPEFFTKDKRLAKIQEEKKEALQVECRNKLKKFGVAVSTIDRVENIDAKIVELLQKHKSEKR